MKFSKYDKAAAILLAFVFVTASVWTYAPALAQAAYSLWSADDDEMRMGDGTGTKGDFNIKFDSGSSELEFTDESDNILAAIEDGGTTGNFDITGTYKQGGSQIDTGDLSDGSNVAHINAAEAISGVYTFSAAPIIADDIPIKFGTDSDIQVAYDETTDDRLEWSDGTNLLAYLTDNGSNGSFYASSHLTAGTGLDVNAGTMEMGADDTTRVIANFYGDASVSGSQFNLYNAANEDTEADRAIFAMDGDFIVTMIGGSLGTLKVIYSDVSHGGALMTDSGVIGFKEITTPTALSGYGKVYTKTDDQLYFQNGAGVEFPVVGAPSTITTDTTPTAVGRRVVIIGAWTTANDITDFDNEVAGQELIILGGDADCNIVDGSPIQLVGDATWNGAAGATLKLISDGTVWYELSRSDAS